MFQVFKQKSEMHGPTCYQYRIWKYKMKVLTKKVALIQIDSSRSTSKVEHLLACFTMILILFRWLFWSILIQNEKKKKNIADQDLGGAPHLDRP